MTIPTTCPKHDEDVYSEVSTRQFTAVVYHCNCIAVADKDGVTFDHQLLNGQYLDIDNS